MVVVAYLLMARGWGGRQKLCSYTVFMGEQAS
jgi:hypothetical protein